MNSPVPADEPSRLSVVLNCLSLSFPDVSDEWQLTSGIVGEVRRKVVTLYRRVLINVNVGRLRGRRHRGSYKIEKRVWAKECVASWD